MSRKSVRASMGLSMGLLMGLLMVLCLCASCEQSAPKEEKAAASTEGTKGLADVDVSSNASTLASTFLNPYATRDRALADVSARIFSVERDPSQPPALYVDKVCEEVVDGCQDLLPETRYFHVHLAALAALAAVSTKEGDTATADQLTARRAALVELLAKPRPYNVPLAAEPLMNLFGDPVLALTNEGLDVLIGQSVARRLGDAPALDAEEADPSLVEYFAAIALGDVFSAAGVDPPASEGGKRPRPGSTRLQLMLAADAPAEHLYALLMFAYEHKHQAIDLVVRSREYDGLSAFDLNLVKASILGSDQSVEITSEQVIWRDTKKDETQAVTWEGLERIGEIVSRPRGQLVLYIEIAPDVTGQQLADALAAIRLRCGGQEICPTLQIAIALKRHQKDSR